MAIKLVKDIYNTPGMSVPVSSLTLAINKLMAEDRTNSVLVEATASVGTIITIGGVLQKAIVSGTDTVATIIPIVGGPGQIWEVDCTNTTATNQLYKAQPMTDSANVANTSSNTATSLAVFVPTAIVGSAATKKLQGYFIRMGQTIA